MTRNKLIVIVSIVLLILVFIISFITARLRKSPSQVEQPQNQAQPSSPTPSSRQPTVFQQGRFPTLSITLPVDPVNFSEDYSEQLNDVKETEEYALKNYPDVYLANRCPFKNESFSITNELVRDNGGYYRFNVTLSGDQNIGKEAFIKWLKGLGLKDDQIVSLEIIYK